MENNIKDIPETKSLWKEIYDWIESVVITIICVLLLFSFVVRQVQIIGVSMENTLSEGQRVVISNFNYKPSQGDIIVISRNYKNNATANQSENNNPIIKRVVATEGQWVRIDGDNGNVFVGDTQDSLELLTENYIMEQTNLFDFPDKQAVQVKAGHIFVMGDNRRHSLDSRSNIIGQVDTRYVLGKALYRVYPFGDFGSIYEK